MSVSFVDVATAEAAAINASQSVTIPATAQVGDTLVAFYVCRVATYTLDSAWTSLQQSSGASPAMGVWSKTVVAGDPGSALTFTKGSGSSTTEYVFVGVLVYRGVSYAQSGITHGISAVSTPPTVGTGDAVLGLHGSVNNDALHDTEGNTRIAAGGFASGGSAYTYLAAYDWLPGGTHNAGPTSNLNTTGDWTAATVVLNSNHAPNAPAVNVASTIDSGASNVISAPFSDPDTGDSCSQTDFQWWDLDGTGARVGGPYTHTSTGAQPTQWTAPGGTFTNGDKEIQAKSYDALGVASPWGASAFFTAATPTGMPTITDPLNGGTVGNSTYTVAWTTAGGQVGYQVRRVADNAGAADATTVYWDSGQVTDANARSLAVPFETNNRWEHVQVSVTADGTLWSSWADARVDVSYTAPMAPTVSLSPDASTGSLLVTITNPVPSGGAPSASYNNVYVDDGKGKGKERVITYLATNTAWRYMLPVGDRDYSGNLWVEAVGTNGVTAQTTA